MEGEFFFLDIYKRKKEKKGTKMVTQASACIKIQTDGLQIWQIGVYYILIYLQTFDYFPSFWNSLDSISEKKSSLELIITRMIFYLALKNRWKKTLKSSKIVDKKKRVKHLSWIIIIAGCTIWSERNFFGIVRWIR